MDVYKYPVSNLNYSMFRQFTNHYKGYIKLAFNFVQKMAYNEKNYYLMIRKLKSLIFYKFLLHINSSLVII